MNQKFENNLFELEVKTENGESLFNAETVARSLGFTQSKNGKEFVRWERVNEYLKKYSPQLGKVSFISEPMVYKLAFKANNALAEKFQDWLAVEVLPTIRKTGSYSNVPANFVEALRLAADLEEEKTQLKIENEEMKPKAVFSDAVRGSKNSCLVKDLATVLKQNGINIGQNRLFDWLRDHEYLCKNNRLKNKPTQKSMELGIMDVREHVRTNSKGEMVTTFTPLITGKGQIYFVNKFLEAE